MESRPWLKHYDKGVPEHLDYPPVPLFQLLEDSARKYPNSPCTIFKGATISFAEMSKVTDRLAAGLAELGVKKGDRVGMFIPNTPQYVMAYFAILKLGAVVVATNPLYTPREIEHQVNDAGIEIMVVMAYFAILKLGAVVVATNPLYTPREIEHQVNDAGIEIMVVMSNFYNIVKQTQPKTKIRTVVVTNIKETLPPVLALLFGLAKEKKGGFRVELAQGDVWMKDLIARHKAEERPKVEVGPDDVALLQYSGGTTGISKGAIALHRNPVANALQIRSWMPNAVDGKETVLMAIPLYHVYGMVAGMLFSIYSGAGMVMIPNPRDTHDVLESIQKYKTTIFPGVPAQYNAINNNPDVQAGKYNLSSIKGCISGSAPLLRETREKFEALTGGKLVEGYGLTEAPTATHCNPLQGEVRTGSIGIPFPDVDARIISLDDGVTALPPGEVGELVIKGPQVFKGYHNMPTETANALREGWLYTGDIARMDEDGYFYIVDRKKELIKPSGYQVWPREVEEVIAANPKVLEVGVAGVPDAYRGETVKAWVVLKPGETATEAEIREWCKGQLAVFKVPTQVEFRSELPKTTVGKILRRELVREHKEKAPQ